MFCYCLFFTQWKCSVLILSLWFPDVSQTSGIGWKLSEKLLTEECEQNRCDSWPLRKLQSIVTTTALGLEPLWSKTGKEVQEDTPWCGWKNGPCHKAILGLMMDHNSKRKEVFFKTYFACSYFYFPSDICNMLIVLFECSCLYTVLWGFVRSKVSSFWVKSSEETVLPGVSLIVDFHFLREGRLNELLRYAINAY